MTDREVMQQALEALNRSDYLGWQLNIPIIKALRERLAQPEQEPVAWLIWLHGPAGHFDHKQFAEMEFERRNKEYPDPDRKLLPLYTAPPQQEPVIDKSAATRIATSLGWEPKRKPLMDEEIQKCYETTGHCQTLRPQDRFAVFALARAIEAAHGIKE